MGPVISEKKKQGFPRPEGVTWNYLFIIYDVIYDRYLIQTVIKQCLYVSCLSVNNTVLLQYMHSENICEKSYYILAKIIKIFLLDARFS